MKTKPRWRLNWISVVAALIGLAGLSIFMYPSTAAWWSQYNESKAIVGYQAQVKENKAPGNEIRLEQAREYNKNLSTGNIDVGGENRVPTFSGESQEDTDYWNLLTSESGLMARIKIPAIDLDLPIYHGTSDDVLAHGVGHLHGTSLPVGGTNTHAVLTAHTGLSTAVLFDNLKKLQIGDTFTISVAGEVLTYQVYETQTILPDQTGSLIVQEGKDIVTLVTCTPLGINTHRYLVTAERITPTPLEDIEAAQKIPEIPGFPWWAVILPAGILVAGTYVWRSGYPPKPRKKK